MPEAHEPEGASLPDTPSSGQFEASVIVTTGTALSQRSTPDIYLQIETATDTVDVAIDTRIQMEGLVRLTASVPVGDWPNEHVDVIARVNDRANATNTALSIGFDNAVRFNADTISGPVKRIYFDGALSMAVDEAFRDTEDRVLQSQDTAREHAIPNPELETRDIMGASPHTTVVAYPGEDLSTSHRLWVTAAAAAAPNPFGRIPDGDHPPIISVPPQLEHLAGEPIRFRDLIDAHHSLPPETIRDHAVSSRHDIHDEVLSSTSNCSGSTTQDNSCDESSNGERDTLRASANLLASLPPDAHPATETDVTAVSSEIIDTLSGDGPLADDAVSSDVKPDMWDPVPVDDRPTSFEAFEVFSFTRWWISPANAPSPKDFEISDPDPDEKSPYLFRATVTIVYCGTALLECELETRPNKSMTTSIHQDGYLPETVREALCDYITSHAPIPTTPPQGKQSNPYRSAPLDN